MLAEGVARLRAGKVIRDAGYDGEYGVIRLFEADELRRRTAGDVVRVAAPVPVPVVREGAQQSTTRRSLRRTSRPPPPTPPHKGEGRRCRTNLRRPLVARRGSARGGVRSRRAAADRCGPGAGKTRTLVHRIAHLVADCGVAGAQCLAITFTRRAAAEMRKRLTRCSARRERHRYPHLPFARARDPARARRSRRARPGFRIASEAERAPRSPRRSGLPRPRAETLLRAISKAERGEAQPSREIAAGASTAYRAMR